jgi:hypothetical protein
MKKRIGSAIPSTHHLFVAHPCLQHYAVSVCGNEIRRSETTRISFFSVHIFSPFFLSPQELEERAKQEALKDKEVIDGIIQKIAEDCTTEHEQAHQKREETRVLLRQYQLDREQQKLDKEEEAAIR